MSAFLLDKLERQYRLAMEDYDYTQNIFRESSTEQLVSNFTGLESVKSQLRIYFIGWIKTDLTGQWSFHL